MKRLKLFPKIFLYTLALLLLITFLASGMIYLLAPIIASDNPLQPGLAEDFPGIAAATIPRNEVITRAVLGSFPYTIGICIIVSLICAFLFSLAMTKPIEHILNTTTHMAALEQNALCVIRSNDEIEMLSKSVNELYQKLLSTIEHLKEEKDRVSEAEKQKVDFLRAASHELKTPVTALNAMLENMIMEVGKYKDYSTFLPLCKEQTEQLGKMISEILDASKLNAAISDEQAHEFDAVPYLTELCGQYELIAQANGKQFHLDLPQHFTVCIPPKMFAKALSNVLSNAISYTDSNGEISVYIDGRTLRVENECSPISEEHLNRIFEPFYRPDYARTRDDGGNGLGLYIVASILNALKCSYSFCPMENPLGMRFSIEL
ncbi:MAG: HAMP domain-containing sensor histidine kinase [Lachnospiraceae bacterium]|nr:HAMP domain-containing sensor histidine kinase [Lachnospiraceae bacterium]